MNKRNQAGFSWLIILLLLIVLAGLGFTGYKVFKKEPAKPAASTAASSTPAKSTAKSEAKPAATTTAPTAAELENIKASITSKNTAALEGYMASSVNVIIAASEAYGPQTPVQAVKDVDYVSAGTTWDFALTAATLAPWQAGDYKQYFPATALVGKSSNNYVISFQFDSAGKISGIFMTNNDAVL